MARARASRAAGGVARTTRGLVDIVADIETRQGTTVDYRPTVAGRTLFASALVRELPGCGEGFRDFRSASGRRWRCHGESDALRGSGRRLVAEFHEPEARRRTAIRSLVGYTFRPLFALPVLLFALVAWAVTRALGSIRSVSESVAGRSVDNLERLPRTDRPRELLPVVDSVDELLAGIDRGDEPVGGLPALARLQSAHDLPRGPVDVGELLLQRLGLLAPQLEAKDPGVELVGRDGTMPARLQVDADEEALALLLDNLLGNAIPSL